MFVAAVIRLRLITPLQVPLPYYGKELYAGFLELVSALDQSIVTTIRLRNEDNEREPCGFTSSDLRRLPAQAEFPGIQFFAWRITSIAVDLSKLLVERLLPVLPSHIVIGEHEFAVEGYTTDNKENRLAGCVAPAELVTTYMFRGPTPSNNIVLNFASATTFHNDRSNLPLPLPAHVFGHYLECWNTFGNSLFSADLARFAEQHIVLSRFRLKTDRIVRSETLAVSGFTGICRYTIASEEIYWLRLLHLLSAFAFWSGTGDWTALGLGQTSQPQQRYQARNSIIERRLNLVKTPGRQSQL